MNAVFQAMPRAIAIRSHRVRTRTALHLGSGLGILALAALAQPAFAADECGVIVAGVVTCTPAGNPYAAGVVYTGVTADTTINAATGTIITTPNRGITATSAGNQSLTLNAAPATITSNGTGGVYLDSTAGTGSITSTTGSITATGAGAAGVFATATSGNVALTGGSTSTNGTLSIGLVGQTTTGSVTINSGTVNTAGLLSRGVFATSTTGNVLVNAGTIATTGDLSGGVEAITGGAGTANVQGGTITTAGANSAGVTVTTATGAATAAPLSVTTTGAASDAVRVTSSGGSATAGSANTAISATGAGSRGIVAAGLTGVTVNYGTLTSNDSGVVVNSGAGAVVNGGTTGLLTTTGAGTTGIDVTAAGTTTLNVGRVSATGLGSRGIVATTTAGALNVTSAGVVANGDAVTATNTGGAASVVLGGTNNSVAGTGAVVNGSTTAALTLNGGTLNGAVNGATLTSATGSTVTNTGTITGTNAAIVTGGAGAATINNNVGGTITGRVLLGTGADTVNNAGTFNATAVSDLGAGADVFNNTGTFNASADTNFGAGADVFNNSGSLNVRPGLLTAGTVTLTNLETFNNTGGLIDLRNGHTGDVLALPGTYNGTGNARLAVDVNLNTAPTTSDLLTIGGAATGSTAVTINRLGSPAVLSTAAGTTFVDAGAGSSANAFVIAPASQVDGVIQYGVVFDPTTNNFALVSAPSAAAYRTSLFSEGVRNLWLQSGDAWTAHMRELRDNIAANGPGGSGGRFWFQGFGNWEKRTSGRTVTFNGITSNIDLGYDQDYYGFQLGLDLGTPVGPEGGFNFGVTGGYQSSNMSFPGVSDSIRFNSINGGVYASFNSGIFFVNALGKYDYYWGENRSPAGLYAFDINGGVWGAKAEAGLRFGNAFWVEPAVSVSWTNSDFGDFTVPSGTFAIDDEDGVRGKAGARIGWTTQWGDAKVSLYGGANYVKEFRGRTNVVFTSGGQTAAFSSPRNQDYGEGILGVNVGSASGKLSGFFEGRYAEGNDYDGYGVRGGVRVRF